MYGLLTLLTERRSKKLETKSQRRTSNSSANESEAAGTKHLDTDYNKITRGTSGNGTMSYTPISLRASPIG